MFKKFLKNKKASAFIENLMIYICIGLIGITVITVITSTIKDAAAGSPYQDEINGSGNNNYSEADLSFYEQYRLWPGTYYSETKYDGETVTTTIIVKNDGSLFYQRISDHPIWGGRQEQEGKITMTTGGAYTFEGGGPGITFPGCALQKGGCE